MADPDKKEDDKFLQKEVNVKFKPIAVLKVLLLVMLLVASFTVGRFTADTGAVVEEGITTAAVIEPVEEEVETELEPLPEKVQLLPDVEEEVQEEPVVEEEPVEAEEEVVDEDIITDYTSVKIVLNGIETDWRDTWGKITQMDITITNNEAGTIKPYQVELLVEGYDDISKKAVLPLSAQTIPSGESVRKVLFVPHGGFAYSEITAGDLGNVLLSVSLEDANGKPMAGYSSGFGLEG